MSIRVILPQYFMAINLENEKNISENVKKSTYVLFYILLNIKNLEN